MKCIHCGKEFTCNGQCRYIPDSSLCECDDCYFKNRVELQVNYINCGQNNKEKTREMLLLSILRGTKIINLDGQYAPKFN